MRNVRVYIVVRNGVNSAILIPFYRCQTSHHVCLCVLRACVSCVCAMYGAVYSFHFYVLLSEKSTRAFRIPSCRHRCAVVTTAVSAASLLHIFFFVRSFRFVLFRQCAQFSPSIIFIFLFILCIRSRLCVEGIRILHCSRLYGCRTFGACTTSFTYKHKC